MESPLNDGMHNEPEAEHTRTTITTTITTTATATTLDKATLVARVTSALVLLSELIGCTAIIHYVPYTEIDWTSYMEQVRCFLGGEYDYMSIQGQTGPLVYPAGFVYLYTALYHMTQQGIDIIRAQYIFMVMYVLLLYVVHTLYRYANMPAYVLILLSCSKRAHSIFILRLFNDGPAMLILYCSILFLLTRKYIMASLLFSLALSIKMNILLFAPAYLLVLFWSLSVHQVVLQMFIIVLVQSILGLLFLLHEPWNYLSKAFEFSRVFFYKWTVNLKVLPESLFVSPYTSIVLLILHLVFLLLFLHQYCGKIGLFGVMRHGLSGLITDAPPLSRRPLSRRSVFALLCVTNFCGIVFARSLHYQFYVWYFFSLPFLLDLFPHSSPAWLQAKWPRTLNTSFNDISAIFIRLLILGAIEVCWNIFPSTVLSSSLLITAHLLLLSLLVIADFEPQSKLLHHSKHEKVS